MGDGRYYSSNQFFSIVYLTMLIIFIVVNFMIYLYKGNNKTIMASYASFGMAILLRFVEAIAVSTGIIKLSGVLSNTFLVVFVLFHSYLLVKMIRFVDKKTMISLTVLFSLSLSVLLFNFDSRIIVYVLLAINLIIVANYFIPYRVPTSVFGDIKELVLDYVFIVDGNGKIIYKNNNIANSHIFSEIDKIDITEIKTIFTNSTIIRKAYDKSFIKILDYDIYFQYNKKEIMDEDEIVGHIITFTDITDLIHMLDNLELKKEQAKDINIELALYKEIVYDTEKEREINSLLHKIADNQQQSMQALKVEIQNMLEKIDENFDENIIRTIERAKDNLLDVRTAVSEYINYYDK
ncbi:MAG: hypothetical protein RBR71_04435 [Gudongella sp.]|nr:hypothetical protein [Gudongella sp.]